MVNNIVFEIDTLEKDVIKRKIMPWKISEVPEEMMVRYNTMTYHNNLKYIIEMTPEHFSDQNHFYTIYWR